MEREKLNNLEPNKTRVFYSPVEGKDVLVRTGVINSPYCILHALLHASSKDYSKMEKKAREKLVKKFSKNIEEKISDKKWLDKSSEPLFRDETKKELLTLFSSFYNLIQKDEKIKNKKTKKFFKKYLDDKETYSIIFDLVSLNTISKCIDKLFETNIDTEELKRQCQDQLQYNLESELKKMGKSLDLKRKMHCEDKYKYFLLNTFLFWDKLCKENFSKTIKGGFVLDKYSLELLSNKLNRDIFVLNADTRLPIDISGAENIKGRKSLILLWFGNLHYEVVGKLLTQQKIQRQFDTNDRLIRKIYSFLYNKDIIPREYPSLIPYLENKKEKKTKESDSTSESDSSSDTRSTSSTRSTETSSSRSTSSRSGSDSKTRSQHTPIKHISSESSPKKLSKFSRPPRHPRPPTRLSSKPNPPI